MKKFMLLIVSPDDGVSTLFVDSWDDAERNRQNAECGMGCYVECYERVTAEYGDDYQRLY